MAERASATGYELASERGRLARQGTQRSMLERQRTTSRSMMSLPLPPEGAGASPGGVKASSSVSTPLGGGGKRSLVGMASRGASVGAGLAASSSRAIVSGSSTALGATTAAARAGSSAAVASASAVASATTRAAAATAKLPAGAMGIGKAQAVAADSAAGTCAGLASMAASAAAVGATMASAQQEAASKLAAVYKGNAVRRSLSAGDKEDLAADIAAMDDDDGEMHPMEASPGGLRPSQGHGRSASEGGTPSPQPIESGGGEARQRNAATPPGYPPGSALSDLGLGRGPAAPATSAQHMALDRIASMNRRSLQNQYLDLSTPSE